MDPPRGACLLGDKITPSGQETHPDRCTECTCANSTVVCKRETCQPLDCPVEKQTFSSHNQCCPQCPRVPDRSDTCQDSGKMYTVGIGFFFWKKKFSSRPILNNRHRQASFVNPVLFLLRLHARPSTDFLLACLKVNSIKYVCIRHG